MYVNGQLQIKTGNWATWNLASSDSLTIATGLDGSMDGIVDEIQIVDSARNSSWINASYQNQLNPDLFARFDTTPPSISNIAAANMAHAANS